MNRSVPIVSLLLVGSMTFAAPAKKAKKKREIRPLPVLGEKKLNVPFKSTPQGDVLMDIYYPAVAAPKNLPVILYTHGGGWAAGSKNGVANASFGKVFLALSKAGFCVVSVGYRLCRKNGVRMRDCVIDSKDALRYLAKHKDTLGVDPARFYVMGDSAGGHIAQMVLLSPPDSLPGDKDLAKYTYKMVAGVSWYGPCDFEDVSLFNHDDRKNFRDRFGPRILGSTTNPADKLKLYREMSPINYLTNDSPPLLMIQGDKDTTIPVKHAYCMQKKLETVKAPVEVMIIHNAGHNWRSVGAPIEPSRDVIIKKTVDFLISHL